MIITEEQFVEICQFYENVMKNATHADRLNLRIEDIGETLTEIEYQSQYPIRPERFDHYENTNNKL